jgi:sulfate adenylyltransferase (ADP) / ATP adenylyltransferase
MKKKYPGGNISGASQSHKHLQFVQMEDEDGPPVEKLARTITLETPGQICKNNSAKVAIYLRKFCYRQTIHT